MKLIKIKRKVTGERYDNIELEAQIDEGEDIFKVANELDELARSLMDDIYKKQQEKENEKSKKNELKWKVERFLKMLEGSTPEEINKIINENDLPF